MALLASVGAARPGEGAVASGPAAKSYILKAGWLYPGDGPPMRHATMVVRDGRIEWIREGTVELPNDLPVVDRSDSVVVPGFVAAESTLADAFEERSGVATFGTIVTFRNVDPLRRAIDGFSFVERRDALLSAGVTTAYLSPGQRRLVNGRGAIVKLAGGSAGERTLREVADLSLSIGDAPKNPPGKFEAPLPPSAENPITPAQPQFPRSRAGALYAIREAFDGAMRHAKEVFEAKSPRRRPPFDPELEELAELIKKRQSVRLRTNAAVDVEAGLSLFKDFGLGGTLVGAAEAEVHAAKLKEAGIGAIVEVPVVGAPLADINVRAEAPAQPARTAAILVKSGVRVAIAAANDAQWLDAPLLLASAMRAGMSRTEAVRCLTADAAKILNVGGNVGTLTAGRDADFLVLNGEPGDATTSVRETYVNGKVVFDRADVEARRREFRKVESNGGSIVVKAGLVIPLAGEPIANGSVAIQDGRILAVGRDVPVPRGARVIDAGPDAVVTPGLIDSRSFLGLEGDPTPVTGAVALELLANSRSPESRWVAAGGVTTVLLQGMQPAMPGTPVAAIKTGGLQQNAVVREVCGIVIPTQGNNADAYRQLLKRGKDYSDRWDKYFADLDKAREDAAKAGAESRKAEEKPDAKKDEAKPAAASEQASVDPVTGTWEGEVWGGPLPRRESFLLKLKLRGDTVSGSFSSRSPLAGGQEMDFDNGKFKDNVITITITRPEIPVPLNIEARIDRPDHFTGKIDARVIALDMEATRIEKAAPSISIQGKAKKKGGLEMPPVDETLEPYRRLVKNDAALVVRADAKADVEAAIVAAVDEMKLSLVVWGGADTRDLAAAMAAKRVGLLTGPALLPSKSESGLPLITEMAMLGVPIAIGSESSTGAARIQEFGTFAVSRGVGADTVLRALTIDPAKLFRLDGRIGSLEPGKDGDLVIWSGMPFRANSEIRNVVIGGELVAGGMKD
jgi:imidazolonepropionase-like amidohydrolase